MNISRNRYDSSRSIVGGRTQNTQMGHGVEHICFDKRKKGWKIDRTFYWWRCFRLSPLFYCCPIKLSLQISLAFRASVTSHSDIELYFFRSHMSVFLLGKRCERQAYTRIINDDVSMAFGCVECRQEGWAAINEAEKSERRWKSCRRRLPRNLQLDLHLASQRKEIKYVVKSILENDKQNQCSFKNFY